MTGLSPQQRSSLERAVVGLRKTLEQDLGATLAGRFGINQNGTIDQAERLRLGADEAQLREELLEVLEVLRQDSASAQGAVARLVREAAFTHANRLTAVRIAEATDLLPESLGSGRASAGYHEVLELSPRLRDDPYEGYWLYLRWCGDELAPDAPGLFDPRNPLLDLAPSAAALDRLVALLADNALSEIWAVADTLGWVYQFFNTPEERREMRESSAPRDARELAVRNQFFTPSYVVRFLVENTLGRRLVQSYGMTDLADDLPLLVGHDEPDENVLPLDDVRVLDPACGSGHFLLGCYDLLERTWGLQGVGAEHAAKRILPCLHGIDIDPRAVQVATAALVLRARRAARTALLPSPEVVCARSLPATAVAEVEASLDADQRQLLRAMQAELDDAPVLGPLLVAEQRLQEALRRVVPEAAPGDTLFRAGGVVEKAMDEAEASLLDALSEVADRAESTRAERLLTAEAADAVRFVDALRRRYDAVLMNPPFGEPVPSTKAYLRAAYPWLPPDSNLFAAFVGRGLDLCQDGGYLGAITSRAGMFNATYERWREGVFLEQGLTAVADLGGGVMEQAMVEAAAYVIGRGGPGSDEPVPFIRLIHEPNRAETLAAAIAGIQNGTAHPTVYHASSQELAAIPGKPVAYWVHPLLRRLFSTLPSFGEVAAETRLGTTTGDDFRYMRCAWEVAPTRTARSREETNDGKRWIALAKGGEYSPFWADLHLVLDWERDGDALRASRRAYVRSPDSLFRRGVTWPPRTQGGFNARLLPDGAGFGNKGPVALPRLGQSPLVHLAWLNSRPSRALLAAVTTFGSYEVGAVGRLPMPDLSDAVCARIAEATERIVRAVRLRDTVDETARIYLGPELIRGSGGLRETLQSWDDTVAETELGALADLEWLEATFAAQLGLDDDSLAYISDELATPVWELPDVDLDSKSRAVVDAGVSATAGSFSISPTLEPPARALGIHPRQIAARRSLTGPTDAEVLAAGHRLLSWFIGIAFGRWHGQRLDTTALPSSICSLPIRSPAERLEGAPVAVLLDEPHHGADLVDSVARAAQVIFGLDDVLDELVAILGAKKGLRDYVRRRFFRDHLMQYSKSRREAPLYWPLAVPSLRWGAWIYGPLLSREVLHGVVRHADRRLAVGVEDVRRLQGAHSEATGLEVRSLATRIDEEQTLLEELRIFRAEVARLAGLGWDPNLEDGFALNAAMLRRLFAPGAWRKLDEHAKKLKSGGYPWAALHEWREHA